MPGRQQGELHPVQRALAGEHAVHNGPRPRPPAWAALPCRGDQLGEPVVGADLVGPLPTELDERPVAPAERDDDVLPRLGLAVSVTDFPLAKLCEQLTPQLMPAGELVTEPWPEPLFDTVRRRAVVTSRPSELPDVSL